MATQHKFTITANNSKVNIHSNGELTAMAYIQKCNFAKEICINNIHSSKWDYMDIHTNMRLFTVEVCRCEERTRQLYHRSSSPFCEAFLAFV